jgi:hypothetical protein
MMAMSEREETTPTQIQNQSLSPKPFPQTVEANQLGHSLGIYFTWKILSEY